MAATATILFLFGLSCPDPCPLTPADRAAVDQAVVRALADRGFEVRPPMATTLRPTGPEAALEPRDEARLLGAARIVVLDYEIEGGRVWIHHFVRGTVGAWSVARHACGARRSKDPCPGLVEALVDGLRPRRAEDVDFVGLLQSASGGLGRCVQLEDQVGPALRIFGKVEMDLEVTADGKVRVVAVAPARVAKADLGACLRAVMEGLDVGPFDGPPVRMRIPLDL